MFDLLAVCQRIPPYYSVLVTCLILISNVLSVYQRICGIFHTSAYVGAICRSVTGPLSNLAVTNWLLLLKSLTIEHSLAKRLSCEI